MTDTRKHPIWLVASIVGFITLLWLLASCGSPTGEAEYAAQTEAASQTPWVVTATQEPVAQNTAEPTIEPAPICPPEYMAQVTVGYIPDLDLGEKKSPVTVTFGCMLLTVDFGEGVYLQGLLAEDGESLDSCVLYGDHPFPCTLELRNLDNLNVRAFYFNKNGERFAICLAISNKDHNQECG